MLRLADLVTDWGGFEELIKDLHNTGSVSVERNVKLVGKSGCERQIDVVIRHQEGFYQHLILAECKYWNRSVERSCVDALASTIRDLNASKGVIFSTKGFQSGAVEYARTEGINLYLVRELSDGDWGAPGKTVDFFMQFVSRSIRRISIQVIAPDSEIWSPSIELCIEDKSKQSQTCLYKSDGKRGKDVEDIVIETSETAMRKFFNKPLLINAGEECARYIQLKVPVDFKEAVYCENGTNRMSVTGMKYDLLMKVYQRRFVYDRGDAFQYALLVENRVAEEQYIVSCRNGDDKSDIHRVTRANSDTREDVLKNGSIITIFLKPWFDPSEVEGLEIVEMRQLDSTDQRIAPQRITNNS